MRILLALMLLGSLRPMITATPPPEDKVVWISEVETLEDTFTAEELNLIYRVVESEAGHQSVEDKSHVASVIFNMINHPKKRFGKTVKAVIKCPNRFCYGARKITESTKEAVQMAWEENTAPGCYAFHSNKKYKSRFAGFTYKFTDKAGHHFYGE